MSDITLENWEDDEVVSVELDDGTKMDFIEIAGIAYKDRFYAILQPTVPPEGMEEDDALVFEVYRDEEGNDKFKLEHDDDVIEAVFKEYCKLLDEVEDL